MKRTESYLSHVTEETEMSSRSHRSEESNETTCTGGGTMEQAHRRVKSSASGSSIGSKLSSLRKKFSTESVRKLSRSSPLGILDGNARLPATYTGDGRKTRVSSGMTFDHQFGSIENSGPNSNRTNPYNQYTSSSGSSYSIPRSTSSKSDFKKQNPSNNYTSDPQDTIQYTTKHSPPPSHPSQPSLPTPPRPVALPPLLPHSNLPCPVRNMPKSFFSNSISHEDLPTNFVNTLSSNSLFNTNTLINKRSPTQPQPRTLKKSTSFSNLLYDTHPPAPTPPAFELVPLSGLISQSYRDIKTLRALHQTQDLLKTWTVTSVSKGLDPISESDNEGGFLAPQSSRIGKGSSTSVGGDNIGLPKSGGSLGRGLAKMISMGNLREKAKQQEVVERKLGEEVKIDFDKIERNLKAFEDLYRAWVECGEDLEEIHLVAMVAREGDLVRSVKKTGGVKGTEVPELVVTNESLGREKDGWADCGM